MTADGGRQTTDMARTAHELHVTEENVLLRGIGAAAPREVMRRLSCGRKRANKLIIAVQKLHAIEARNTSRDVRKSLMRKRLEHLYERALSKTKAVAIGVGIGLTEIDHVPDPDIRAAIEAVCAHWSSWTV